MSWHETWTERERLIFFNEWKSRKFTMKALCERYGVSRKTGYKFVNRICTEGKDAVCDRGKARHTFANITPEHVLQALLKVKARYRNCGPKKIRDFLLTNSPELKTPAASTIGDILKRHGLVRPRKKRPKCPAHSEPLKHCLAPNDVWSIDFKGQFKLQNGQYCYPLTISDNFSRYLICCEGFGSPTLEATHKAVLKDFKQYGLPKAIRSDNGQPFAGLGIGGLTRLSAEWVQLGIHVERIPKGRPDQNGRHERMHRTLKQETANPSSSDECAQQEAFDKFKHEYNTERPHEALGGLCPKNVYTPSKTSLPAKLPQPSYPKEFLVRRVRSNGEVKWQGKKYYISDVLIGKNVGLEMLEEGRLMVFFATKKLGIIDARGTRIDRL